MLNKYGKSGATENHSALAFPWQRDRRGLKGAPLPPLGPGEPNGGAAGPGRGGGRGHLGPG